MAPVIPPPSVHTTESGLEFDTAGCSITIEFEAKNIPSNLSLSDSTALDQHENNVDPYLYVNVYQLDGPRANRFSNDLTPTLAGIVSELNTGVSMTLNNIAIPPGTVLGTLPSNPVPGTKPWVVEIAGLIGVVEDSDPTVAIGGLPCGHWIAITPKTVQHLSSEGSKS